MSAQLATRVRKARAQSVCGLCPVIIRVGNQIGKVPGVRGWCHVSCILEANRICAATRQEQA